MRDLLIDLVASITPTELELRILIQSAEDGAWADRPVGASFRGMVMVLVDLALARGWAAELLAQLRLRAPTRPEIPQLLAILKQQQPVPTAADPLDEVLLASDRPFVNRHALRHQLRNVLHPMGSTLLLIDGEPQTGKSHTYYLLEHVARRGHRRVANYFVKDSPMPAQLAGAIMQNIGANEELPQQGPESAERWSEKLATAVKVAVEKQNIPRFLVFDEFPPEPLPPGTLSFIVRLARFADEELRHLLRIMLVGFPGQLPPSLEDVAVRDEAQPFTATDMFEVMRKIAAARKWDVSDEGLRAKLTEFEALGPQTLRDRFLFLRRMILQLTLATAPMGGGA